MCVCGRGVSTCMAEQNEPLVGGGGGESSCRTVGRRKMVHSEGEGGKIVWPDGGQCRRVSQNHPGERGGDGWGGVAGVLLGGRGLLFCTVEEAGLVSKRIVLVCLLVMDGGDLWV